MTEMSRGFLVFLFNGNGKPILTDHKDPQHLCRLAARLLMTKPGVK